MSCLIKIKRARAIERSSQEICSIRSWFPLAGSSASRYPSRLGVHLADSVVPDVAYIKVVGFIEPDAVRFVQLRVNGQAAIAGKSAGPSACDRADDTGFGIELSNGMIEPLNPE